MRRKASRQENMPCVQEKVAKIIGLARSANLRREVAGNDWFSY